MVGWSKFTTALLTAMSIIPQTQAYPYAFDNEDDFLAPNQLWNRAAEGAQAVWNPLMLSELVPRTPITDGDPPATSGNPPVAGNAATTTAPGYIRRVVRKIGAGLVHFSSLVASRRMSPPGSSILGQAVSHSRGLLRPSSATPGDPPPEYGSEPSPPPYSSSLNSQDSSMQQ